jgi:cold shock CspA family protein
MNGTVIRVIRDRGFCFFRGDDGISYFGHCSSFQKKTDFELLREGQAVSFEATQPQLDKYRAEKIRVL